jgi:hypothetical protein
MTVTEGCFVEATVDRQQALRGESASKVLSPSIPGGPGGRGKGRNRYRPMS